MQDKLIQDVPELVNAFHLMWDHFPGPCSLIHKSRLVIAVNPACKLINREVGARCLDSGLPESHKSCLADKALAEHQMKTTTAEIHGVKRGVYWLPVDGYDEYYVHFSIPLA